VAIDKALSDLKKAIRIGGGMYIEYAREDVNFKDISKNPRFIRILSKEISES
jgi:hypothetical protein